MTPIPAAIRRTAGSPWRNFGLAGRRAELRGRNHRFLQGLALFSVASALCALPPGIGPRVAARALQTVGALRGQATAAMFLSVEIRPASLHTQPR